MWMNPFQGGERGGKKGKKRKTFQVAAQHCARSRTTELGSENTCDTLDNSEDTKLIILLNSTIIQQREADKC